MNTLRKTILLLVLLLPGLALSAKTNYLNESPAEKAERMAWFKEARFGMFIHWGVYSVHGGIYKGTPIKGISEWIMRRASIPVEEYEQYAQMFNPLFFDAEEWVDIAAEAGMKYIVITSKHHDGFALWDSEVSDWDIMDASPFQRDILRELADACAARGIRLCFYHSIMDWHHPDAQGNLSPLYNYQDHKNPNFPRYLEEYMKPQLKELIEGYGPLGILWFDGEWISDYTTEMGKDVYQYVRELQPDIIINNRVDKGRQGMMGLDREGNFAGDYGTPEQEIPDTGLPGVDWESCMTMNNSWGWKSHDLDWKSAELLIQNLVDIVSKGGNYLLNVGPTHEGLIPAPSVERLAEMGAWLKANGESIYGATASPFERPSWGRFTRKGDTLYAHIFDWPAENYLYIPYLDGEGNWEAATLLPTGRKLKTDPGKEGLVIHLPETHKNSPSTVIRVE